MCIKYRIFIWVVSCKTRLYIFVVHFVNTNVLKNIFSYCDQVFRSKSKIPLNTQTQLYITEMFNSNNGQYFKDGVALRI